MSIKIERFFESDEDVAWSRRTQPHWSRPMEVPAAWSDTAAEIAVSKYFRKTEDSVRQLIGRVVQTICQAGEWQGYLSRENAGIFASELTALLTQQIGAFNSPVWFNCGLFQSHGVAGKSDAFAWDFDKQRVTELYTAYIRPQVSACFIQNLDDDLLSIFDLVKSEAKLFKYGSGSGTNFSRLRARGESIDGGAGSPGLISYLEIFDKAAQVMRSGGTTRRAAKMVVVDADHPEIEGFISWKVGEERKARVLLAAGFGKGFDSEAFRTVSGQNSNNSVRVNDAFMKAAVDGGDWPLTWRTTGLVDRQVPAQQLFNGICQAAWECADPGLQFHDTIQRYHTCSKTGPIRASNPCSEFLFLDDSACNLASVNLVKFLRDGEFNWEAYEKACRLFFIAQEILVDFASYPTAAIAENSHRYRPLGLGFTNLGGLLMRMAIPYDSELAADWTAALTATLHWTALETSCELASAHGAFEGFSENRDPAIEVLEHQRRHLNEYAPGDRLQSRFAELRKKAAEVQNKVETEGLRNSQVSLIAPTGTIGLFMDCDTLGIEPDFSLVKIKHLVGGQTLRLINHSVAPGLRRLGYTGAQIAAIEEHLRTRGHLTSAPHLKDKDQAVFDTAVPPAGSPERMVSWQGHLRMTAAAQPFLSGGISKTVNLPASATVDMVREVYLAAWRQGLKCISIYRDGSKALQPLCLDC